MSENAGTIDNLIDPSVRKIIKSHEIFAGNRAERSSAITRAQEVLGENKLYTYLWHEGTVGSAIGESSNWNQILMAEKHGSEIAREEATKLLSEKPEKIPPETRTELAELFEYTFADAILAQKDPKRKIENTPLTNSLREAQEFMACAPMDDDTKATIMIELMEVVEQGNMVVVSKFKDSKAQKLKSLKG